MAWTGPDQAQAAHAVEGKGMTPAITIGIMTHNYGRYIQEAIESVITQSRTDWELIISDDASTDNTAEIVAPYLADPRVSYVRHPKNLGQSGNWSYLLDQGTAPLLAVLHADDQWLPGTLEKVLAAFEANPEIDLLYGNWWRNVEGQEERTLAKLEKPHLFSGHDEYRYQVSHHTWLPSATFLSRRAVNLAGRPNSALTMLQDTEYFLRVSLHSRQVCALSEPLMVYRVHQGNATAEGTVSDRLNEEKAMMPEICRGHLATFPHLRQSIHILRRASARSIFSSGVTAITHGHSDSGQSLMRRAVRLCPTILCHPKRLLDFVLSSGGPKSNRVFRRLHHHRL
jgi:hypothetical protein